MMMPSMRNTCFLAFLTFYFVLGWETPLTQASIAQNLQKNIPEIIIESDALLFNERIIPLSEPVIITPAGEPALLLKDILLIFDAKAQLSNNGILILQLGDQTPIYINRNDYWRSNAILFINTGYESEIYVPLSIFCDGISYYWERKEKLKTVIIYTADYRNHLLNSRQMQETIVSGNPPQTPWGTFENGSYLAQLWPHSKIAAGYYTTIFDRSAGRLINVKLACELINGTTLAPGDIFSFNQTVGPRSTGRGFRVAKIFHQNEIIDGIGGGICQVSSTLYNCAVSASFEIIERHRHSLRVNYVASQQDATVSWGSLDFRFKNTSDKTITIFCQVFENYVVIAMMNLE